MQTAATLRKQVSTEVGRSKNQPLTPGGTRAMEQLRRTNTVGHGQGLAPTGTLPRAFRRPSARFTYWPFHQTLEISEATDSDPPRLRLGTKLYRKLEANEDNHHRDCRRVISRELLTTIARPLTERNNMSKASRVACFAVLTSLVMAGCTFPQGKRVSREEYSRNQGAYRIANPAVFEPKDCRHAGSDTHCSCPR